MQIFASSRNDSSVHSCRTWSESNIPLTSVIILHMNIYAMQSLLRFYDTHWLCNNAQLNYTSNKWYYCHESVLLNILLLKQVCFMHESVNEVLIATNILYKSIFTIIGHNSIVNTSSSPASTLEVYSLILGSATLTFCIINQVDLVGGPLQYQ